MFVPGHGGTVAIRALADQLQGAASRIEKRISNGYVRQQYASPCVMLGWLHATEQVPRRVGCLKRVTKKGAERGLKSVRRLCSPWCFDTSTTTEGNRGR